MSARAWRWLLPVAPLLMAAMWNSPLVVPEPIVFPRFIDSTRVSEAIMTALTNRRWAILADTGESIRAQLTVRGHRLQMRLDYSPRGITFHYLDSDRLDYEEEDGHKFIHRNAVKWMRQLATEVQMQVQRHYYERDPAAVVPLDPTAPAN